MRKDQEKEEEENVIWFFKGGGEEYAAIIVPRDVAEYFIHYKNQLEKETDFKYESLGHYLHVMHETTLESDEKVGKS